MRSAARAFVVVIVIGAIGFLLLAALKRSDHAFSLNVPPSTAAVELRAGAEVCQGPIDVPIGGAFDAARVQVGTVGRPGEPLRATLRDQAGQTVARTTVPAGYADNSRPTIALGDRLHEGTGFELCLENAGRRTVYLYGSGGDPNPSTELTGDAKVEGIDLALTFHRPARSLLASTGDILERATLFRTPRLSTVAYGLLLLVLLGGAATAIAVGLRSAQRDERAAAHDEE
jgi:hypothetical protein